MLYAIVAVLVLILDQAVKYSVTVSLALDTGSKTLIPGVLSLVNIHNKGAAFGLLSDSAFARWLFILVAVVFVAAVVLALTKNIIRQPLGRWSAVLVMSGAVGNCIDRIMTGYVVDMFRLDFMNFAVFNVADIFITVCGILFCVYIIFGKDFHEDKKAESGGKTPGKSGRHSKSAPAKAAPAKAPAKPAPAKTPAKSAAPQDDEGVRTYRPRAAAPSGADPFAAWDALPPVDARPKSAKSVDVPPKYTTEEIAAARKAMNMPGAVIRPAKPVPAQTPEAEEDVRVAPVKAAPAKQPASPAPAKPAPAKPAPKKSGEDFTLEDILAEYGGK